MAEILLFPNKHKKRKPVQIKEITEIGLMTLDDRVLYIENREDLNKIMRFIIAEKINILEEI